MPVAARISLIRHAASSGQAPEASLTVVGRKQAEGLAEALGDIAVDALYSCPYRRARETIAPFAKASGLHVVELHDLRKRLLSPHPVPDWLTHIERSFDHRSHALSGGESFDQVTRRATIAL